MMAAKRIVFVTRVEGEGAKGTPSSATVSSEGGTRTVEVRGPPGMTHGQLMKLVADAGIRGKTPAPVQGNPQPQAQTEEDSDTTSRRDGKWTVPATHCLLELYKTQLDNFATTTYHERSRVWEKISAMMLEKGFRQCASECSRKLRNLKTRFKQIKSSEIAGTSSRVAWEFYEKLNDLFDVVAKPSATGSGRSRSRSPVEQYSRPSLPIFDQVTCNVKQQRRSASPERQPTSSTTLEPEDASPRFRRRHERPSTSAETYDDFVAGQRTMFRDLAEVQWENLMANKQRTKELKRRNDLQEKKMEIQSQKLELLRKQLEVEQMKLESARKLNEILEKTNAILDKAAEKLGEGAAISPTE